MALLALRVLVAPCFVVCASLVARRFGAHLGGLFAGLPVIAGPILLVLAVQHGSAFAGMAAVGVLLGIVGLAAFVLAYVTVARWRSWPLAALAAYTAFALVVIAMRPLSFGAVTSLLVAGAALVLTIVLLPRPVGPATTAVAPARWDLPLRAAVTAAVVISVTAIASTLGAHLSGLLATFPIITAVLSVFTHAHRGHDEAVRLLRGFAVGFFSYGAFAFVVATTIRSLGIGGAFALATGATLCVQAVGVVAGRRHVTGARRPTRADVSAPDYA